MSEAVGFEQLIGLWEEGRARLSEIDDPADRRTVDRVVDVLIAELRRRVGVSFTTDELARFYLERGTDWCFEIATREAPSTPAAWDMTTVGGAAFARFVRFASDFGGGRRLEEDR
jgi:hypothetical protein